MQVRISRLNRGAENYQNLRRLLQNDREQLGQIASEYRGISCVDRYRRQLSSISSEIIEYARQSGQLAQVLNSIADQYQNSEMRIADRCEGVRPLNIQIPSGMQTTTDLSGLFGEAGSGEVSEFGFSDILEAMLGGSDAFEWLGDTAGTIGSWSGLFKDSEFMNWIHETAGEIGKNSLVKLAGFIGDQKDMIEAWGSGDLDGVEKYFQKIGTGLVNATIAGGGKVLTGIEGGVYMDFAWNMGKDFIEKAPEVLKDPSVGSVAGLVWESTVENYGQALWKGGTKLASASLSIIYPLLGKEFDEADFDMAMDYLGGVVGDAYNAVKDTVVDIGTGIWNGFTGAVSWFGSLF